MMLEIITLLTHMILLSDWEPPGVSSWILPKGAPPVCERGGAPAPAGAEATLCMYVGLCVFQGNSLSAFNFIGQGVNRES